MQKLVTPSGMVATFEGSAVYELSAHDPERHRLPVTVQIRGNVPRQQLTRWDAFNALDLMIVTSQMAAEIRAFSDRDWPLRRARVFCQGVQLDKDFVVLIIDVHAPIGVLRATEADWTPDAAYPVRPEARLEHDVALDKELLFPVLSDELVDHLRRAGFAFEARRYPVSRT